MSIQRFCAFASLAFIVACGGGSTLSKNQAPAYFSGLAQQIQVNANDQINEGVIFTALCGGPHWKVKQDPENRKNTYDLSGCEANGVKITDGTIVQTWNKEETEGSFKGTLKFEVTDPDQNAIADCQKLLKKGDTSSCTISSTSIDKNGETKRETKMCGIAWEDFIGAFDNKACSK